jgi:hypothetical protein
MRSLSQWQKGLGLILGEATMTQTDQMSQQEVSFRSDEQAQSQDRERLQSEIQEAWDRMLEDHTDCRAWNEFGAASSEADIKLLKWALGVK